MNYLFQKGHVFSGPDGMGYVLTRDIRKGDLIKAEQFRPINGALEPQPGAAMPDWLKRQIPIWGP